MAENFDQEITQDVTQTLAALAPIAEDETTFRLLVQSFRAQDHEGFRDLLARYKLLDRCELVCQWLCAKHCALLCLELCGPPPKDLPLAVRAGLRHRVPGVPGHCGRQHAAGDA